MINNRLYIALTCALLAFACLGLMITSAASPAYAPAQAPAPEAWEKLSEEQQQEMLTLLEEKTAAERALVEKAAEYGLIPEEKAQKIQEKLTQRLEKAKTEGIKMAR